MNLFFSGTMLFKPMPKTACTVDPLGKGSHFPPARACLVNKMMELYYPNTAWLFFKDAFDRLYQYKSGKMELWLTWEQAIENLTADSSQPGGVAMNQPR